MCHVCGQDGGDNEAASPLLLFAVKRREQIAARLGEDGEGGAGVVVLEHGRVVVAQGGRCGGGYEEGVVDPWGGGPWQPFA